MIPASVCQSVCLATLAKASVQIDVLFVVETVVDQDTLCYHPTKVRAEVQCGLLPNFFSHLLQLLTFLSI